LARGLLDAAWSALRLATDEIPEMPWNDRLGPRRQLFFTTLPFDGVSAIRRARGATVNDVVLCVLAGGLHRYLRGVGIRTQGLELIALVPVSVRRQEEAASFGNRISAIPREPRFLCGRRVESLFPIVPITDGLGLGLAVLSYHDGLHIGLNADPSLVPDLEKLGHAIEHAFSELCARA
jgi:hypothetical protein